MNDDEMEDESKENDSKSQTYETAKAQKNAVCPWRQLCSEHINYRKFRRILRLL